MFSLAGLSWITSPCWEHCMTISRFIWLLLLKILDCIQWTSSLDETVYTSVCDIHVQPRTSSVCASLPARLQAGTCPLTLALSRHRLSVTSLADRDHPDRKDHLECLDRRDQKENTARRWIWRNLCNFFSRYFCVIAGLITITDGKRDKENKDSSHFVWRRSWTLFSTLSVCLCVIMCALRCSWKSGEVQRMSKCKYVPRCAWSKWPQLLGRRLACCDVNR